MKIAIAADHGGFILKNKIGKYLEELGHQVVDLGTNSAESVDYPDYAEKVGRAIQEGQAERGILVCGTGIGIGMAANKMEGIRAATVENPYSAKMAIIHNNANVLCLGERVLGDQLALMCVEEYLNHEFEGGRHQRRVDKIMALEEENHEK